MKHYLFASLIALLLFSCSEEKIDTDKVVQEIKNATNLSQNVTSTLCGEIKFKLEDDQVRHFFCDSYMGDGGTELNSYFSKNKLIYAEYSTFYDGPAMAEDGTTTEGGDSTGDKYRIYFENEKMVKCFKNDKIITDLNPDEPVYDPDPVKLVDFAHKVVKAMNTKESEVLCDMWF